MKKMQFLAIAALVAAATFQMTAKAADPVSPVQGAVCRLYAADIEDTDYDEAKVINELFASLSGKPALATFVDTAADFKDTEKKDGIGSNVGKWTGWLKQEKAGLYTFLCTRGWYNYRDGYRYSIWINGQKCIEAVSGQCAFNVELQAGFNSVEIITEGLYFDESYPLSISYKKEGSVKDPVSFGPGDMFYDDEE